MKRHTLSLGQSMTVEAGRDWNGFFFIAYARGSSMFFREEKELKRYLKLPLKTASRDALDLWLAELPRGKSADAPVGDANVEGSFDPLAHALDETDPNFQTKTVI